MDRPFQIGREPNLYRFRFPNKVLVDRRLQLCCRHELHICIADSNTLILGSDLTDALGSNAIEHFAQTKVVPEGFKVDVPLQEIRITPQGDFMVVYLVVYSAESLPLTRALADSFRATLETEIGKALQLRQNRAGRMVSKPFPPHRLGRRDYRSKDG